MSRVCATSLAEFLCGKVCVESEQFVQSEQSLYVECVAECLAESRVCGSVNLSKGSMSKSSTHQMPAESLAE